MLECVSAKPLLQVSKIATMPTASLYMFIISCSLPTVTLQLILYLVCHSSWDVRRVAHEATKRITAAVPQLSEDLLSEFANWLSVIGERTRIMRKR